MKQLNRITAANRTYTQVGASCFYESEVQKQSSVLLMNFSAKNRRLRQYPKRYVGLTIPEKHPKYILN